MQSLADHATTVAKASSVPLFPHDANARALPRAVLWETLRTDLSRTGLFHATATPQDRSNNESRPLLNHKTNSTLL